MSYDGLMAEWVALTISYPGWSLNDIKKMSNRERNNWLEIAKNQGRLLRK
jgi:hypothetical protein